MKVLIGVDVGGSKTAAALDAGEGAVHRAAGPGAAVRPGKALASALVIAEVVRQALGQSGRLHADVLVVGAAGAGRTLERSALRDALRSEAVADEVHITTDIEIALEAAFGEAAGIVVSAGTGSIAVGRDRHGKIDRIGGYGWQMGDEGSGYAIGRAALGAVGRAADGRSPDTALHACVMDRTGSRDFDQLIRWAASAGPAEVAALAPHVLGVAADGDRVAQGIADYAARELSQLAITLAERLSAEPPIAVAVTGGLLGGETPLRRAVLAKLGEAPHLRPAEEPVDAALGALAMARRLASAS
jgi:N-acetylglucosamine kinase-like BadF-type ATPase